VAVKLFVAAVVPAFLLILLEAAARILGLGADRTASFGRFEEQVHVLLRRGLFVRDPDLFWKLAPVHGLQSPIAAGPLRVSSLGLRGPEWPRASAPGTIRIVALGDSCTFGWGVPESGAYPEALGRALRDRGLNVEVINAGVPGYTSLQAARLLRRDLLPLRPRIVTLCFGWNELWPARGQPDVAQAVSGWRVTLGNQLERLHLYRLLRRSYLALRTDLGSSRTERTVPRVSAEHFGQILSELSELCRRNQIALVLVTQPARATPHSGCWSPRQHELLRSMWQITRQVAAHERLLLVDAAKALAEEPQNATFSDCVHPTESGHAKMAAELADALDPVVRRSTPGP
jgi:lysophospholipase L1-like esterase